MAAKKIIDTTVRRFFFMLIALVVGKYLWAITFIHMPILQRDASSFSNTKLTY